MPPPGSANVRPLEPSPTIAPISDYHTLYGALPILFMPSCSNFASALILSSIFGHTPAAFGPLQCFILFNLRCRGHDTDQIVIQAHCPRRLAHFHLPVELPSPHCFSLSSLSVDPCLHTFNEHWFGFMTIDSISDSIFRRPLYH